MFPDVLQQARVIVSVGSGGVGKTTVSAAIAMAGALQGKKVLVMTIDPARRLANALGMSQFDEEEYEIPPELWRTPHTSSQGRLFAMMLDQKLTFDRLVDRFAPSPETATRIRNNVWYQQMSSALSGVQDYMAVERLYEMSKQRDYDLIVLDTPPTSNALDFLDAPERIKGILQMRSWQWLQDKLSDGESHAGRFLRWSGSALIKLLGKVTGQEVMHEIWTLLEELSVLYESFQEHAEHTWSLLQSKHTQFVQISVPKTLSLKEALFLQQRLLQTGMTVSGFVLNRVPGYFEHEGQWLNIEAEQVQTGEQNLLRWAKHLAPEPASEKDTLALLQQLMQHTKTFLYQSELARDAVVFLQKHKTGNPWIQCLPLVPDDVSDLKGVQKLATLLFDPIFSVANSHP